MPERSRDWIWLIAVLVVLVGVLPMLMFGSLGWHMPGMMRMMGYGWGWASGLGFMFLLPLAFLILIALGAYYLITEFARPGRSAPSHGERALEILSERYARGEITGEQYRKMKEELGS